MIPTDFDSVEQLHDRRFPVRRNALVSDDVFESQTLSKICQRPSGLAEHAAYQLCFELAGDEQAHL